MRGIVLLVLVCLVRAAVPLDVFGPRDPGTSGHPNAPAFTCEEHVCGCRTAEDCRVACCCTDSPDEDAPTTPVYSPCGGGGPRVIPSVSTLVALLPSGIGTPCERASFVPASPRTGPSASPSLEPLTPPPREASSST